MSFVESIEQLSNGWDGYWQTKKTNKNHPLHILLHRTLPSIIAEWLPKPDEYKIKGSDGQGNLLRTPWINVMNPSVTESAEEGYYIVYLFDSTMNTLVLELGFGATQFINAYGQSKPFFAALEKAVANMQQNTSHLVETLDKSFLSRLENKPSTLNPEGDFKLRAYEKCSIYHITYDITRGIDESQIKSDFREMLRLYDLMAESVLLPDVEDYVIEAASLENKSQTLETQTDDDLSIPDFVPPQRKEKRNAARTKKSNKFYRRSNKADKIGKLGEEFIYRRECARLQKFGRQDLSEMVIWHREFPENRQPGWDITSFDEQGNKILIEVKSSVAARMSAIEVTANEWAKMNEYKGRGNYVIFLVTRVADSPKFLGAIWDPAVKIENGEFSIQPEIYGIDLRTS